MAKMQHSDRPAWFILHTGGPSLIKVHENPECWRAGEQGTMYSALKEAKEFSRENPDLQVLVYSFTLEKGVRCWAVVRGGEQSDTDHWICESAPCDHLPYLLDAIAEHLTQQAQIAEHEFRDELLIEKGVVPDSHK